MTKFNVQAAMRLYAVTDGPATGEAELLAALEGGVTCVQLREKDVPDPLLLAKARIFARRCHEFGVPFIVNDRVELACSCSADGVHLGQEDGSVVAARKRLGPDAIIGVSVHSVEEACLAEGEGADYLGAGALFVTGTKPDASPLARTVITDLCQATSLPVVGIGGIDADRIPGLAGLGLAGVALVSAIFRQRDILAATVQLDHLTRLLTGDNIRNHHG